MGPSPLKEWSGDVISKFVNPNVPANACTSQTRVGPDRTDMGSGDGGAKATGDRQTATSAEPQLSPHLNLTVDSPCRRQVLMFDARSRTSSIRRGGRRVQTTMPPPRLLEAKTVLTRLRQPWRRTLRMPTTAGRQQQQQPQLAAKPLPLLSTARSCPTRFRVCAA